MGALRFRRDFLLSHRVGRPTDPAGTILPFPATRVPPSKVVLKHSSREGLQPDFLRIPLREPYVPHSSRRWVAALEGAVVRPGLRNRGGWCGLWHTHMAVHRVRTRIQERFEERLSMRTRVAQELHDAIAVQHINGYRICTGCRDRPSRPQSQRRDKNERT